MNQVQHSRCKEEYLPIFYMVDIQAQKETMEMTNFVAKLLVAFWLAVLKMDSLSDFNSWHSSISAELERGEEQYGTLEEQPAHARNCFRLLISIH